MVIMKTPYKTDREIEEEIISANLQQAAALRQRRHGKRTVPYHVPYEEDEALKKVLGYVRFLDMRNQERFNRLERHIIRLEECVAKNGKDAKRIDKSFAQLNQLRKLFGLPELKEKVKGNIFSEMVGLLNEYSEEGSDSVELLHSVRGEEE